jgi:hypothetical protein
MTRHTGLTGCRVFVFWATLFITSGLEGPGAGADMIRKAYGIRNVNNWRLRVRGNVLLRISRRQACPIK